MGRTVTISAVEYLELLQAQKFIEDSLPSINGEPSDIDNKIAETEALIASPLTVTEALKIMADGGVLPDGYSLQDGNGDKVKKVWHRSSEAYPYQCQFSKADTNNYTLSGFHFESETYSEFNLTLKTPTGE